jgi:hypothetical protein
MIEFPIGQMKDESVCPLWLERHLYPYGDAIKDFGVLIPHSRRT